MTSRSANCPSCARTNTVIAAAALIASFLGAAAIREHGGLSAWSIIALVVLAFAGALSLVGLWPSAS